MSYNKNIASTTNYGVVKVGTGIAVTNGIISTNGIPGTADKGYFYSTVTQTNLLPINVVTMSNTTISQGITLVSGSQITVTKTATYNLSVMMQFAKTSGGSAATINFWLRKNGLDVPDSTTDMTISNNNSNAVASWTYILSMNAGEYLQMVWNSNSAQAVLPAIPIQPGPPAIPVTPSVRMTLLQV
jgi:hypothetical protein